MQMDRQYRTIPTFRDIDRACCVKFGVTRDLLRSPSRRPRVTKARQVAMYLMRRLTGKSLPSIGNYFTRDHATVMHANSSVTALIATDPNMSATITEIITAIKTEPSEMDKLREWSARLAAGEVSWVVPPPSAEPPEPVEAPQIIYTDPLALRLAAVAAGQG